MRSFKAVRFGWVRLPSSKHHPLDERQAAGDLLGSGVFPFADMPRQVVGPDVLAGLLACMAGETSAVRPVHGLGFWSHDRRH
jgi:hypothetical protein